MGKSKHARDLQRVHTANGSRTTAKHPLDPLTMGVDGTIFVNTARLGTPPNVYDATFAAVRFRHGAVSLFFAKEDSQDAGRLQSRVELRYPVEGFLLHLIRHSRRFHQDIRKQQGTWEISAPEPGIEIEKMPAAKVHSEWVNFDYMARSGTQASMDFFHLPPSGLARWTQNQGSESIVLVPRIRILTTTATMMLLLDAATAVDQEIRRQMPLAMRQMVALEDAKAESSLVGAEQHHDE